MESRNCNTNEQPAGCRVHFSKTFNRDNVISGGSTAIVERLPCGHVRKIPCPDTSERERSTTLRDIGREHEVYGRIAGQPHFLAVADFDAEHGIVLQGLPEGTLRGHLETHASSILLAQRLKWSHDIATAVRSLHEANIVHADLKSENVLFDEHDEVYLIDFSGSCIDGQQGSALESIRFFKPRTLDCDSTEQTDIFALGSTLYEIITGTQPYYDLADDEVEKLFEQGQFPNVEAVTYGDVIKGCWEEKIKSINDVVERLQSELSASCS